MMLRLALKSLLSRRFSACVCIAMLALSTLALLAVDTVYRGTQSAFGRSVQGIDLIVGAPTGDVNLLLFSAFHVGAPSRELSWDSFTRWQNDTSIERAVPLMLGDSHKGFRVLGTNSALFDHLRDTKDTDVFTAGREFTKVFEVTLGSEVAHALSYHVNDELVLSHGLGNHSFHQHDARTFKISGILAPTGTPVDKTLQVSLEGLEAIHLPPAQLARLPKTLDLGEQAALTPASLSAFYLTLKSKVRTFQVQRAINNSQVQPTLAILPGVAVTQLWSMLDWVEAALLSIGLLAVLVSAIGVLSTLLSHLDKRIPEFRLLQTLGAKRRFIYTLLGAETSVLVAAGMLTGILLTFGLERGLQHTVHNNWGLYWPLELHIVQLMLTVLGTALLSGIVVSLIGALRLTQRKSKPGSPY